MTPETRFLWLLSVKFYPLILYKMTMRLSICL